jgi:hypothetical protein
MRRLIFALSLLGGCLCFASASMAQRACVLAPDGDVVCGPLVQPGYAPPQREYRGPPPYDGRRDRDYNDRRRDDDRREPQRNSAPQKCQPGYTVQGGECKPYQGGPAKCQKGYTVQDGVCKPYTGR